MNDIIKIITDVISSKIKNKKTVISSIVEGIVSNKKDKLVKELISNGFICEKFVSNSVIKDIYLMILESTIYNEEDLDCFVELNNKCIEYRLGLRGAIKKNHSLGIEIFYSAYQTYVNLVDDNSDIFYYALGVGKGPAEKLISLGLKPVFHHEKRSLTKKSVKTAIDLYSRGLLDKVYLANMAKAFISFSNLGLPDSSLAADVICHFLNAGIEIKDNEKYKVVELYHSLYE